MGEQSKIEWTDATWNPFHGCKKISAGCKYCYMYRDKERWKKDPTEVIRSASNFDAPLSWKSPKRIFTCSWSDWFIEEADKWRPELWEIIRACPQHTFQILTKRPERIKQCLPPDWGPDGYPNVWLGISAENQENLMARMLELSQIPSAIRFVSAEPLIGPLDLQPHVEGGIPDRAEWNLPVGHRIDWMIIGGESGNENGKYRYRPCELEWIYRLVDQCVNVFEVPVFVKQLGTYLAKDMNLKDRHGRDLLEWPSDAVISIRQFPYLETQNQKP